MSLLLLRSLGSSYLSQCPALLWPPGFRSSCFSSLLLPCRAPHPCWSASGPPPPPPPPWHLLLLLLPPSRPASLPFSKERRSSPFPCLPVHHQNIPPGISSRCFSTLGWCSPPPSVFSGSGSGSGGGLRTLWVPVGLLMERSSRDRSHPYKRWKSTGDNKLEKGRHRAAGSGGKATETRPRKEHSSRDREPRSKSWSNDRSAERRTYPPAPPPAGVWRNPSPPPPPGMLHPERNATPGTLPRVQSRVPPSRNPPPATGAWGCPPPATLRNPAPGALRNPTPPPPATGAWGCPPPATLRNPAPGALRNPTPPPPGTFANPEDFPPLPGSGPPPQRTQSLGTASQPLQRHWEDSPARSTDLRSPGGGGGGFDFSVMSYNILSQDLLHENAYLYRHCDPSVLTWEFRLPNLLREIQQYDADVLCLQEVQQDHYDTQMKPALEALGYQCVYKKRTGKKPEGCAVVFKSSRLSLVSTHPLEYLRPGDALLDRDNVALVLLLKPANAGGQSDPSNFICVANTHLLYNPRRGDIKLAQLAILLAEISRLSRLPDGSVNPVVLCGDFNSTPWSPLYSFLTQGCLEYKGMPIGMVSGQEDGRGQRVLTAPIWSKSLGINQDCCYDNPPASQPPSTSPTEVEGLISNLTVDQFVAKAITSNSRTRLRHGMGLQSSYSHFLMPDGRAEITTCHSRTAMTVDYILYAPDYTTSPSLPGGRGLQLLARLSLVGVSELKAINGLPNRHHSSDHLPILARFRLRR